MEIDLHKGKKDSFPNLNLALDVALIEPNFTLKKSLNNENQTFKPFSDSLNYKYVIFPLFAESVPLNPRRIITTLKGRFFKEFENRSLFFPAA